MTFPPQPKPRLFAELSEREKKLSSILRVFGALYDVESDMDRLEDVIIKEIEKLYEEYK